MCLRDYTDTDMSMYMYEYIPGRYDDTYMYLPYTRNGTGERERETESEREREKRKVRKKKKSRKREFAQPQSAWRGLGQRNKARASIGWTWVELSRLEARVLTSSTLHLPTCTSYLTSTWCMYFTRLHY